MVRNRSPARNGLNTTAIKLSRFFCQEHWKLEARPDRRTKDGDSRKRGREFRGTSSRWKFTKTPSGVSKVGGKLKQRGFSAARDENLHTTSEFGWRAIAKWRVTRASKTISRRLAFALPLFHFDLRSLCTRRFLLLSFPCFRWLCHTRTHSKKFLISRKWVGIVSDTNEREGNGALLGDCFTYQILLQKAACFGDFTYLCKTFQRFEISAWQKSSFAIFLFDACMCVSLSNFWYSVNSDPLRRVSEFLHPCGKFDKYRLRGEPLFAREFPRQDVQRVEEITVQTSELTKYIIQ